MQGISLAFSMTVAPGTATYGSTFFVATALRKNAAAEKPLQASERAGRTLGGDAANLAAAATAGAAIAVESATFHVLCSTTNFFFLLLQPVF